MYYFVPDRRTEEPRRVRQRMCSLDPRQGYSSPRCATQIDAEDESLNKWKASLGLGAGAGSELAGPRVVTISLSLLAEGRAAGPIVLDLSSPEAVASLKKNPVTIKVSIPSSPRRRRDYSAHRRHAFVEQEGSEYAVELKFQVNGLVTGLKYIQVSRASSEGRFRTKDPDDVILGRKESWHQR